MCSAVVLMAIGGALHAQAPDWAWAAQAGAGGSDNGVEVAPDGSGGVYVLGTFDSTAAFGQKTATTHGQSDIFLARYAASGECQWVRAIGGSEHDEAAGLAVDASGNAYITGSFSGTLMLAHEGGFDIPMSSDGERDFFVAQYKSNGNFGWATSGGGQENDASKGLARDNAGNLYVIGTFNGTMTFDESSITSSGGQDVFVAKLTSLGAPVWLQRGGGGPSDNVVSVAADGSGGIYVSGVVNGSLTFGDKSVSTSSGKGFFLVRYNSDGSVAWAKGENVQNMMMPASIAVDASGNIYAAGSFRGQLQIGTRTMTSEGEDDMFVAGYDRDGNFRWVQQTGGTMIQMPSDIVTDAAGSVYVTGLSQNLPDGAIFVIKYAADGTQAWIKTDTRDGVEFGGGAYSGGIGVDAQGNVYVTGQFAGQIAFGTTVLTAVGSTPSSSSGYDMYIARLSGTAGVREDAAYGAEILGSAPNPCTDGATLRFALGRHADVRVTVSDLQGRIVRSTTHGTFERGEHAIRIAADDLPQGPYLIQLRADDAILTTRLDVIR